MGYGGYNTFKNDDSNLFCPCLKIIYSIGKEFKAETVAQISKSGTFQRKSVLTSPMK